MKPKLLTLKKNFSVVKVVKWFMKFLRAATFVRLNYKYEKNPGTSQRVIIAKNKYEYLDDVDVQQKLLDYSDARLSTITFFIPLMHCASCLWLLENLSRLNPATQNSRVNFLSKKLSISFSTNEITLRHVAELSPLLVMSL
ncbi:MAG: hypothetical protein C0425_06885 [Chlorobiaceae bacterium]|nr:hypothetical protein [Chlorobiaceae bacterium]MBA4310047.1 hypothetical protein [Chlorobiaceae bacterium]